MPPASVQELRENLFDGITWNNASERAEIARKIFQEKLNFQEVKIFNELNKAEIIQKLDELKSIAEQFE